MLETIDVLTLFPSMCEMITLTGVVGRGIKNGIIDFKCHQIRDFSKDKHRRVDDAPYGGGSGMIMQAEPIFLAFEHIFRLRGAKPYLIYMSAKGENLTQGLAKNLLNHKHLAILCGRYEGIDERVIETIVNKEISIGDYVVSGGELPALVLVDCIMRMMPGTLSCKSSFENESHYNGYLEHPQYTRPEIWRGKRVPEILLSGDHEKINHWKLLQSYEKTKKLRPDLLALNKI
ncbi:MAG: tRNA (guanosine(37)-N1)-methyltransferase TrmD [Oscillospiraceae bacterium]|nr:tRNA (guanosine(37)-N1)-methyltransferase TrmD [Oscillospiraceae bacterium]